MIGGRVVDPGATVPPEHRDVQRYQAKPEIAYITIDPKAFLARINRHFNAYVQHLGGGGSRKTTHFETFWDLRRARPGRRIVDHAPHVRLGLPDIMGRPPGTTHMHGKPNPKPEA